IPTRKIASNEGYQKTSIFELPRVELEEEKIEYGTPKPILEAKENRLPQLEYVGQAFGTYLIFQSEDGLYLMDQHAAAERINYEKNYELLGRDNQPTSTLLVPIMLEFTKSERLFIEGHMNDLNEIGFVIEPLSETDYVIRQVPLWAKLDDLEDKIREIFALLMDAKKVDVKILRDEIAKTISCKSSIKANHALSRREIDSLLEQLGHCKNPFTCPHGRPTIIHFSPTELEKMFERIQS
ncbi:MAG: hypothetical protein K2G50_00240, partial [Anaeroplasmataceae bacterium]|nr:hypothetical protein [Anaeroplasmataceae bacterium]